MNENGSEVTEQNSKSVSSEDEWNETSTDEESEHNSSSSENEEKWVDLSEDGHYGKWRRKLWYFPHCNPRISYQIFGKTLFTILSFDLKYDYSIFVTGVHYNGP